MSKHSAVSYAIGRLGQNETPQGSNRGWFWDHVRTHWGVNLEPNPWCGAFVIDSAFHGGLKLPWQMVSVNYVEQWGRRHGRFHYGSRGAKKGDLVILFGGKHVEMASADATSRGIPCVGGNTGGNEPWAGGTVGKQFRSNSQIRGYVKISDKYPGVPKFAPRNFPLKKIPAHYFSKKLKFKQSIRPRIHNGSLNKADKENVARIQSWLKYLGYYDGRITGFFNQETWEAVKRFQKKRGYKNPNGAVGPGTWLAIQKAVYNKRYK